MAQGSTPYVGIEEIGSGLVDTIRMIDTASRLREAAVSMIEMDRDAAFRQNWGSTAWRRFLAWALYRMAVRVDHTRGAR